MRSLFEYSDLPEPHPLHGPSRGEALVAWMKKRDEVLDAEEAQFEAALQERWALDRTKPMHGPERPPWPKSWQRFESDDASTLRCSCHSIFMWEGISDELQPWVDEHMWCDQAAKSKTSA